MAFRAGYGGELIEDPDGTPVTFHVGQWSIQQTGENAVTTNSSSTGWRGRTHVIKDWTFSCELPLDEDVHPETDVSFAIGDSVTIKFMLGAGAKFYQGTAIITGVNTVNNNDADVVRASITGEGNGALTPPVT